MATTILSSNDFYTTVVNNEIINFTYPLSSITIEAKNQIPIRINNSDTITTSYVIVYEALITSVQIMAAAGTQVKWSGVAF